MYHKHRLPLPGIFSNNFRLNNIMHDHDTPGSNDLHVTAVNNNYGIKSITHIASTHWTNLPTALTPSMPAVPNCYCFNFGHSDTLGTQD